MNVTGLLLAGAGLVFLARDGAIDFGLATLFFDPVANGFPLRSEPLLAQVGHTGLRWIVLLVWLTAVLLAGASRTVAVLRPWRGPLIYFCATVAATTASVALLKFASAHSCPWDLQ